MLIKELLNLLKSKNDLSEGEVVHGQFGKGQQSAITIPAGYKSFFTKKVGRAWGIFGVKNDGSEHKISTTSHEELATALAKEYNSGGKAGTGFQPISALQAFGSAEINILHDAGIHFFEKPSYWSDLEHESGKYKPITEVQLQKTKKVLAAHGINLKVFHEHDLWLDEPAGPLVTPDSIPSEKCFIVDRENGKRYLVDRTGASSYFRMWCLIK